VDEHTRNLAIRLYLEYKRFAPVVSPDKVSPLLRCAVFLSEKMQTLVTVSGEHIRGIGLSLNSILRNSGSFDEFIFVLKDFIKRVRLGDAEVEKDINTFIRKFCFILSFHNKFEQTIRKLELKERDPSETPGYLKTLIAMAWLLFIDSRNRILRHSQEVVENMFLLFSVLHYMLCLSAEWVQPAEQFDVGSREVLLARFMKTLNITDTENFMCVHEKFEEYLNFLCEKDTLRYGRDRSQILGAQYILANYKKLDQRYSKAIGVDDLDERLFLKERAATLTPNKLTPFSRQGYTNKRGADARLACQRVLGFEDESVSSLASQNFNPNFLPQRGEKDKPECEFPSSVVFTSTSRTPQLGKTPMTVCVEMYNWLHEIDERLKVRPDSPHRALVEAAVQAIVGYEWREVAIHSHDLKSKDKRACTIASMYYYLAAGVEAQFPSLYFKDKDFHKGLVQMAAEVTYFALNVTTVSFGNLTEVLQVPVYELWKACDAAMQLADGMPSPVKRHLLDIEVNLISQDVWRADSTLLACLREGGRGDGTHERVFKRVLHQIVYQIYQLSVGLGLDERVGDLVLTTVKYVLTSQPQLLVNRHLDQIILCSMYAVCRRAALKKLFNDIRIKYEELNPNNRHMHTEVICSVYVSPTERLDIIKFYNSVYTPLLESFIKALFLAQDRPAPAFNASPLPNSLLHSPLKALLPKDLAKKSASLRKGAGQRSQMMYAYNESPLLKDFKSLKPRPESKKTLNFDDDEGSLAGTEKVGETKEDVSEYINKRCTLLTSRKKKTLTPIRVSPTIYRHISAFLLSFIFYLLS
jgi:hypothetical protein